MFLSIMGYHGPQNDWNEIQIRYCNICFWVLCDIMAPKMIGMKYTSDIVIYVFEYYVISWPPKWLEWNTDHVL